MLIQGWAIPVQQASFRGVDFEVLSVADDFQRDIAKHAYPFVNGEEVEEMGLQARQVQLQAVFFGKGYYIELQRFLTMVQAKGAGVLVHPILGRLPNMVLVSSHLRHEAENVNYVSLDLTFTESVPLKPIFYLEGGLVSRFERFFRQLDRLLSLGANAYRQAMLAVALVQPARSRFMRMWTALHAGYIELTALFTPDQGQSPRRLSLPVGNPQPAITQTINDLTAVIQTGLTQRANLPSLTLRTQFDEMTRAVDEVMQRVKQLPAHNMKRAKREADLTALSVNLTLADLAELKVMVQISCTATLCELGMEVLEESYQTMTPIDIDYLCQSLRQSLADSIQAVREWQEMPHLQPLDVARTTQGDDEVRLHQLIEAMRNLAHDVALIGLNAINQKPPLSVRVCPLNGTLHQVAHAFYGDYRRAGELLRLNPQLHNPNFIRQGELMNAYSE